MTTPFHLLWNPSFSRNPQGGATTSSRAVPTNRRRRGDQALIYTHFGVRFECRAIAQPKSPSTDHDHADKPHRAKPILEFVPNNRTQSVSINYAQRVSKVVEECYQKRTERSNARDENAHDRSPNDSPNTRTSLDDPREECAQNRAHRDNKPARGQNTISGGAGSQENARGIALRCVHQPKCPDKCAQNRNKNSLSDSAFWPHPSTIIGSSEAVYPVHAVHPVQLPNLRNPRNPWLKTL